MVFSRLGKAYYIILANMAVKVNYFKPISDDIFDGKKWPKGINLIKKTGYQNLVTLLATYLIPTF